MAEVTSQGIRSMYSLLPHRPAEEELKTKNMDGNTPAVAEHPDVQESVGPLVAPTPLRPWPQMTLQVSGSLQPWSGQPNRRLTV